MATYKNLNGDYTISLGPYDTGTGKYLGIMTVNGNLNVVGNITYVEDIKVNDAFITVAGNNTGTVTSMGLVAQKSSTTFAGLRYNTITSEWEISSTVYANGEPVGSSYSPISTSSLVVGGSNTQIQFNDNNTFGASANLTFNSSTNALTLTGNFTANGNSTVNGRQVIGNIGATPAITANSATLYNKGVGVGGTGLYIYSTNSSNALVADTEVSSVTKAQLWGIIF
jgi:hypothetical protein